MTHEVKNPLNAMRIHLELLRARLAQTGTPAPPEIAENIDVIAHEIQRLDRVVQGFLRFVRPQDLRLAPVDVNAVLSDVARVARPEAARAGVEIVLEPGRGLPRVTADSGLIAQASANLVSNAIQAMPGGGTLVVASRRAAPDGVEIRVADQGVGIAPENLEKIFRLYYTTKAGGSGIGLAMVYRIVQMHDGRVDVESTVGKGTTVTLRSPRLRTHDEDPGPRGACPGPVRMQGARPACPAVGAARPGSDQPHGARCPSRMRRASRPRRRPPPRPPIVPAPPSRAAAASGRPARPRRADSLRAPPASAHRRRSAPPATPVRPSSAAPQPRSRRHRRPRPARR